MEIRTTFKNENNVYIYFFFKRFYLFIFREGKGGRKRERNISVWLPLMYPLLGTQLATQARALDWELNWRPFGSQTGTQSTEPHQPGLFLFHLIIFIIFFHNHLVPLYPLPLYIYFFVHHFFLDKRLLLFSKTDLRNERNYIMSHS